MAEQELIARIERAENDAFVTLYQHAGAELGVGWYDIDGIRGVWSSRDDDPGYSCVINLDDAPDPAAALAAIEAHARAAGAPVLGIDGSPQVVAAVGEETLARLGYEADYEEHMWGLRIGAVPPLEEQPHLRIHRVGPEDRETFARVLNVGYELPEAHVRGHIFASTIGKPGWTCYLVEIDGVPGAASVLYVTERVAQLFVATTMPAHRGRGAQTALIRMRLQDAVAAGCDLATSQTVVDNASPRNMLRHGFEILYTRWIYGKEL